MTYYWSDWSAVLAELYVTVIGRKPTGLCQQHSGRCRAMSNIVCRSVSTITLGHTIYQGTSLVISGICVMWMYSNIYIYNNVYGYYCCCCCYYYYFFTFYGTSTKAIFPYAITFHAITTAASAISAVAAVPNTLMQLTPATIDTIDRTQNPQNHVGDQCVWSPLSNSELSLRPVLQKYQH